MLSSTGPVWNLGETFFIYLWGSFMEVPGIELRTVCMSSMWSTNELYLPPETFFRVNLALGGEDEVSLSWLIINTTNTQSAVHQPRVFSVWGTVPNALLAWSCVKQPHWVMWCHYLTFQKWKQSKIIEFRVTQLVSGRARKLYQA